MQIKSVLNYTLYFLSGDFNMYNKILVEFEFLIDLDLAIFKLIKDKYNNPEYINQDIIKMNDESKIVDFMI